MSGFNYPSAAAIDASFSSSQDGKCRRSNAQRAQGASGGKINRVVMIVGLERCRCGRIGFVLVATARIVEQGGNDRQQHDHDDAEYGYSRDQELDNVHVAIMARQTVKSIYLRLAVA
jgi:hypothetical protein